MKASTAILGLAFALASVAQAASSTMPATTPPTIVIDKFAFTPGEITVVAGTTVVWLNHDQTPHAIAARDHSFASKAMDTDDRFEHRFATAGDFSYVCSLHPFMTGIVHVRPTSPSAAQRPRHLK
ncbi:cupredoxin domain-containing protein [Solilutibacter silvestris]|uniref:Plastocyanin n=1 Tax=Solilutibacter silvestris TaxID=1645665 RepID=A0A2K1PXJ3_9GAMM|nr:cupredoxin family copper-binding protein [Lysobacter silvestris]PNS07407.1 Plastocyanin [Lysobacter silvestris]